MGVPINYLAVLAATISSMIVGYVWYGPLFGKSWMAAMGIDSMRMEQMKAEMKAKGAGKSYALMFVGSLVMAFVLAHALVFASAYLHASGISAGLTAGFWNWLGFIAPVLFGSVLWEQKPMKLYYINVGYYLVTLCVMGMILAAWPA